MIFFNLDFYFWVMKKKLFTEKQKPKTVVILGYLSMILRVPQSHT